MKSNKGKKEKNNGRRRQKNSRKSKNEKNKKPNKGTRTAKKSKKGGKKAGSKKKGDFMKTKDKKRKKIKQKRKSENNVKGKGRQTSTATVKLSCLRDAVTYTKFLKDNVVNFLRRNTRLTAQNALTNKKASKKGEYKEPAARLIQAGGGDKTNLSCSGSTTGVGAKKITTLTDILDGCALTIEAACKKPSSINTTTLKTCQTNALKYNTTVSGCIASATKGEDACSCFQAAEVLAEKKVLENCKGKAEAKAAAKARTACLKAISKCKNASSNAATLQYACSYSTKHLLDTLKQLTANLAAFGAFMDKITALTGVSPTVGPGASNSTLRKGRSVEESEDEAT